jgi:cytochrome c556
VSRFYRFALLLVAAASLGACYQDPEEQMAQQQLMQDMSDVVNQMGLQVSEMQGTLDSLKGVVAKQDTAIYRMANVTGVPYVR